MAPKHTYILNLPLNNLHSISQSQNPFMDVDGDENAIKQTIYSLADRYEYSSTEDELLLKLKYYVSGVPFHFHLKLMKCNSDVV